MGSQMRHLRPKKVEMQGGRRARIAILLTVLVVADQAETKEIAGET